MPFCSKTCWHFIILPTLQVIVILPNVAALKGDIRANCDLCYRKHFCFESGILSFKAKNVISWLPLFDDSLRNCSNECPWTECHSVQWPVGILLSYLLFGWLSFCQMLRHSKVILEQIVIYATESIFALKAAFSVLKQKNVISWLPLFDDSLRKFY